MKTLATTLAACLLLGGAVHADDDASHDLGPRWVEGQKASYRSTTKRMSARQIKATGLDAPAVKSVTTFVSDVDWRVDKVNDDGSAQATMTVTDLTITIETPTGETLKVDRRRADKGVESVQQLVKALVGKPMEVDVDSTGHVTQVKGWKSIKADAGEAGESLTERDFVETASDLAVIMGGPADAAPGKTWNEKPEWDHELGTLEYDSQYELTGVEPIAGVPIAIVAETSKIKLDLDKDKITQPPNAQVDVKLTEGARTSQIMFDLSRHEVAGAHSDQKLVIEMTVSFQGRSFSTVMEQETSSQLIRLSEE